jgi:glycosyltransferase involved in cell wall biosynthesis
VSPDRLVFSPYCVDATPFQADEAARARLRADARRELRVGDDERVILYSGKLSQRKGVELLPDAVRLLPPALRERVTLVFVGDGEERAALQARGASAPSVKTIVAGFQNQTRLSPFYHAADVLTLPSRHAETWGLVVNEALHHGLPCVVSDRVGCAPDLIRPGVTGEVFEAGSAAGLAVALEHTLGRSVDIDEAARAACRRHVAGYSVDRAAAGIAQAYASAVSGRQPLSSQIEHEDAGQRAAAAGR